jgi:hypothetical protein
MKLNVSLLEDITRIPIVRKTLKCANGAFSITSVIGVGALAGLALLWSVQRAPSHEVVYESSFPYVVNPGKEIKLQTQVTIRTDAKRAVYHMWLTDRSGATVYVYPTHEIRDAVLNLDSQTVQVPSSIGQGAFTLNAEYLYPFNPFKNAEIKMVLAKIVIKE